MWKQREGTTNLRVSRTGVSLCVQSKELLGEFHPQVTVHRAVVITWTAGLQGEREVRGENEVSKSKVGERGKSNEGVEDRT